jgi:sulfite exporter TauE/SafE
MVLLVWFALALAGLAPEPRLVPRGLARLGSRAVGRQTAAAQLLFGVANGFLPCGLVYSALSIPVALADPVRGGMAMLAFGSGTLPALTLATLGLRRILTGTLWRRRLFAALVLAVGSWAIWTRANHPRQATHRHHIQTDSTTKSSQR